MEIRIDETGHFYRMSPKNPWIRMEDETEQSSIMIPLQREWEKITGILYSPDVILAMLEKAELISVSYPMMEPKEKSDD